MKALLLFLLLPLLADEGNAKIDYAGFEKMAGEVGKLRAERRIAEAEFLRMAAEPGTVVLDTRSKDKFEQEFAFEVAVEGIGDGEKRGCFVAEGLCPSGWEAEVRGESGWFGKAAGLRRRND